MNKKIKELLKEKGFEINENAQAIIKACDDWYCGRQTEFHKRENINSVPITIDTINFAKRVCADDANLCEIVEINAGDGGQYDGINEILNANRFDVMYRKQLERMSANGTVGCYIYLDKAEYTADGKLAKGRVRLNYCNADEIIPLTVVNDEIIECAFVGSNKVKGQTEDVCVIFTLDEQGNYVAESHYYIKDKEEVEKSGELVLGDVKPFAIMTTAEVNNFDDMEGYGYPKLWSAIPVLKMLDLAFFILNGDLDKGEKIVFVNELLGCIKKCADGTYTLTKKQKELFVLLGEKLPTQNDVIQEYNPELRIEEITKIIETLLSILSLTFGYGTKKYTFENGQIKTASEYIGERQDAMQELNKQRKESTDYITTITNAIIWFSSAFGGENWEINLEDINIEYDDSYVEDKGALLERTRNDALSFDIPILKVWYLMDAYNLDEEEAKKLVGYSEEEKKKTETEDANNGEDE